MLIFNRISWLVGPVHICLYEKWRVRKKEMEHRIAVVEMNDFVNGKSSFIHSIKNGSTHLLS